MTAAADRDFDVLVVGAGVIATTMASLLVARRLVAPGRVALIAAEPPASSVPESEWDLRVFALSRASQRVLEITGAWAGLPPHKMNPYERMCVWDANGEPRGRGSLTFDCAELGEPNLGFIVEGRALHAQCLRAASAAGVVSIETGVDDVITGESGIRLRLRDGRELGGQLLIGADGTESKTRALLGIETAGHAYHQDALVTHVRTALPHAHTAWQRFLATGPLAFLPLPDGRSSIVWSMPRAQASRLRGLDPDSFGDELTRASAGVLGSCELTTAIANFPLRLQYALDYVRPRAVLLGDAAHVVHPLAGQGLNLGLLDCASLADVLRGPGGTAAFGEHKLLRRYERGRRSENLLMATALDGMERLFASGNPALSRLRVMGLGAVGRIPLLRRELAERALGLKGDIPALLTKADAT
jgi:2-polyprenylphenol 6-hydroxylase